MRVRVLLAFLPRRHHLRYGDEIEQMLRDSDHVTRDKIDLAVRAIIWNLEGLMDRPWALVASLMAGLSLFGLGYATADLAGGLAEAHRHWWSTAPVAGLALAGGVQLLGRFRTQNGRRSL